MVGSARSSLITLGDAPGKLRRHSDQPRSPDPNRQQQPPALPLPLHRDTCPSTLSRQPKSRFDIFMSHIDASSSILSSPTRLPTPDIRSPDALDRRLSPPRPPGRHASRPRARSDPLSLGPSKFHTHSSWPLSGTAQAASRTAGTEARTHIRTRTMRHHPNARPVAVLVNELAASNVSLYVLFVLSASLRPPFPVNHADGASFVQRATRSLKRSASNDTAPAPRRCARFANTSGAPTC